MNGKTQILITQCALGTREYEFVERKGVGHPDTLADGLAEELSRQYSKYTLTRFGVILHHNFDKVGLLGGASSVSFGRGFLTKPIRVLLNGRASYKYANKIIPLEKLLKKWATKYLHSKLHLINCQNDIEFHYNLSTQSSPGKTNEKAAREGSRKYWFEPRGMYDIQETKKLLSNDTSLGVGYAPISILEKFILNVEETLNSLRYKQTRPWLGSDIKILGYRHIDNYQITICIPQIANYVQSLNEYTSNLDSIKRDIEKIAIKNNIKKFTLSINTRDNLDTCELYLTAIGSSIESGDEGLVGRGNRINGVISPCRPMSMEGSCGKNPVYHIGKVYYVAAMRIAELINIKYHTSCEVFLASQSGRQLIDPWIVQIGIDNKCNDIKGIELLTRNELKNLKKISHKIIDGSFRTY